MDNDKVLPYEANLIQQWLLTEYRILDSLINVQRQQDEQLRKPIFLPYIADRANQKQNATYWISPQNCCTEYN